jgi:peptide deformylase
MSTLKILTAENEILHKTCKPVTRFDEDLWTLLDDMKATLSSAKGVGLAGPQVGVLKRVFVIDVNGCVFEVVNPRIVKTSGTQCGPEGCLSIPGKFAEVTRPKFATVEFFDRYNNKMTLSGSDLLARALLHENDHLNGILYTDLLKGKN